MGASGIGALVGLLIAAADYFLLRLLASRVELDDTKRVLNITGCLSWAGSPAHF